MRRPPYSILARHYDEVYATWRAFLGPARDEVLRAHGAARETILDLGCGSGWQSLDLARGGARVLAVDPVASFLPPLRKTARAEKLPLRVRRGSLAAIPADPGEQFDLVLVTFDVFNHLRRHDELEPALTAIFEVTRPGGHLLFDVNTPETIQNVGDHNRVTRLSSGGLTAETGSYDPDVDAATVDKDWFLPAPRGTYTRVSERYHEIAWPKRRIHAALRAAGFTVRLFDDAGGWLSFLPEGSRWIVLARRPRAYSRGASGASGPGA